MFPGFLNCVHLYSLSVSAMFTVFHICVHIVFTLCLIYVQSLSKLSSRCHHGLDCVRSVSDLCLHCVYCCPYRLSGFSPFMGDNEGETMSNILKLEWDFEDECFDEISDLAKQFIENLLVEEKE